jgi:putative intracellular protease/amidase
VHRGIEHRRRLRATGAAVTAACAVVAVIAAVGFLPRWTATDSAPPPLGTNTSSSGKAALFGCPLESRVFGPAPAIPDLDRQQRIIDATNQHRWKAFHVQRMAPTHLGVVALVSGDLNAARLVLPRRGVEHVYAWDPTARSVGVDGAGQVRQVLGWLLEPAVRDIRRANRGIAGYQSLALWQDAGAVLLQWKAPVPDQITGLAGQRPDGVLVIVEPARYSQRDFKTATAKVVEAIRAHHVDAKWSTARACADGSGLVVGIEPASLQGRRAELQKQLADIARMPVRVIPEDAPVPLTR